MVSIRTQLRAALLCISFTLIFCTGLLAQSPENTLQIGIGAGSTSFYGDVGNQNNGFSPSLGRLGYHLTLSNQVTPYLHGGLEAMFGTVAGNERSLGRNLNFRSEIRSGGIFVAYNFDHFLKEDRFISPIFSVGLSGFEFLSKTDMLDAQGRSYFYWDDGTIRDVDEFAANADEAVIITRDHSYESDLRELDLDGIGDYNERGLAIPLGIGASFRMGPYLEMDIHTRMYLTTTDFIDNVTAESRGTRAGDSRNDRFVYTGFTVRYGLHKKKEFAKNDVLDQQLLANLSDRSDEDKDGVLDIIDKCPQTPEGVQVDISGCPLDSDGDGVGDFADLEINSEEGAYVDKDGVTLTDKEYEEWLAAYLGSGGPKLVEGTIESASIPKPVFTPRPGKKYMVQVGETEEGITADLASLLLSIPDVQTIIKGDTVMYMVGDYENLPDAVLRQLKLEGLGITGTVVSAEDGVMSELTEDGQSVADEAARMKEEMSQAGFDEAKPLDERDQFWRVQVGAFRNPLSYNIFASIEDIVIINGDDGLRRYFSGVYLQKNKATEYREILHNSGFNDAFIVSFQGGERQEVKEAMGGNNPASSEDLWDRASPDGFDESVIEYKILLAESDGTIETDKLEQLRELGNVELISTSDKTYYLTPNLQGRSQAKERLKELERSGLEGASVIGIFNGEMLSLDEVESMLKN